MEWRVNGADKLTGEDRVLLIEADDEAAAVRRAGRQGLMVESARPNIARRPAKSNIGLWLTILIVGPLLGVGLGVYLMRSKKPAFTPALTPVAPPVAMSTGIPAPAPTPMSRTPPQIQPASIDGAAWLQKNGGDSVIMRGLHIYLARPTFSDPSPISSLVSGAIPKWEELIASNRQLAAQCQDTINQFGDPGGYSSKQLSDINEQTSVIQSRLKNLRAFVQHPPSDLPTASAYKILSNGVFTKGVGFPIQSIATLDCRSNVDGKYSLGNIPPGDYVLYASFDSATTTVYWLLPIHFVSGEKRSLDLSNSNSIRISNSN